MNLCCPVGCGWTVIIKGSEKYVRDGPCTTMPALTEYVTGRCSVCHSRVLIDPSKEGIRAMQARVSA